MENLGVLLFGFVYPWVRRTTAIPNFLFWNLFFINRNIYLAILFACFFPVLLEESIPIVEDSIYYFEQNTMFKISFLVLNIFSMG